MFSEILEIRENYFSYSRDSGTFFPNIQRSNFKKTN